MEVILSFISEKWPMVGIAVIVFAVAWWLSKYHSSIEQIKKKVNDLPCDNHKTELQKIENIGSTVTSTNSKVDELKDFVSSMNNTVSIIGVWVMKQDKEMINELAVKASPYKLTPIGAVVLDKSHAKSIIDENLNFFLNEIDRFNPKTAYDVEEKSLTVILSNTNNEIFNDLKDFVYYSPEEIPVMDPSSNKNKEIKISLSSLLKIMSIYLRDEYFKKHPEIENLDFIESKKT